MGTQSPQLIEALYQIAKEKEIDPYLIFDAIETSLVLACKKNYGQNIDFKVRVNRETGEIESFVQKEVVKDVENETAQISLKEAKKINKLLKKGDIAEVPIALENFGRISAQTAKQVIMQKIKEAERGTIYEKFTEKERELATAIIQRKERRNIIVSIDNTEAVMYPNEQIDTEEYSFAARLKVFVLEVKQTLKGPMISVSRTHPKLVERLFEMEVPEIYDGIVEIKHIAREPGQRTKIAVHSHDENVDPIGTCVGPGGSRVNFIVNELRGEKIDIIKWHEDPKIFIESALSPSDVVSVTMEEDTRTARVIVPKHQLSLAIGKDGQNARLAAKLTGYRIDIKSDENEFLYEDFSESLERMSEEEDEYQEYYKNDYDD